MSGKRRFRRADTNVVSVKFNTLLSPGNMHAGDPVVCQGCPALLSHISKIEGEGEKKVNLLREGAKFFIIYMNCEDYFYYVIRLSLSHSGSGLMMIL